MYSLFCPISIKFLLSLFCVLTLQNIIVDIIVKCFLILGIFFINIDGFFSLISEIDNEARKEIPVHLFVNIFFLQSNE